MIRNYLVTAMRNFARHKLYSFINITGLAVGLACAIFIILYLRDELSYEAWIPDSQDIYRIESTFSLPGADPRFFTVVPFPVPIAMQAQIPQVMAETHLIPENMTAKIGDSLFSAKISVVDPNFFQVIKLPLVKGNPARVLAEPDSVVLSETTAKKFFGAADPIGKTVTVGDTHPLTVTGIVRDLPHNTNLSADLVMPNTSKADTMEQRGKESWLNVHGWGYVKFAPGVDLGTMDAKLKAITNKGVDAKKQLDLNIPGSDLLHLHLTRLWDTHLGPYGETEEGSMTMIYGFAAIAALILLIACFNFMNLATARAMIRAREVSLRKVMGAKRKQLMMQFLGESVMTALMSLVLALVLVKLLLPVFDSFLTRPITFGFLSDWPLTIVVVMIAVAAGLLGGVYPALILSGFRPAATLGTSNSGMSGSGLLRTTLVVLQFAISIGLGIATIVVFAQISYARQVDIGFDRHNLVVITGAGQLMTPTIRDSMKQALEADTSIAGVASSNMTPMDGGILVAQFKLPAGAEQFTIRNVDIDPDFLHIWGMKLLAGRNLSRDRGEDKMPESDTMSDKSTANILVTEAAARQLGFTVQGAVGQSILAGFGAKPDQLLRCTIVGVTGNANFDGIETATLPIVYFYAPKGLGPLSVRIKPGQLQPALATIDRVWRQFIPTRTIRRQFQDENFDKLFTSTEKEGAIFGMFVGIAIFIACLGLFGLAAFTAERRTKEIGIRKVFGARTRDIVRLLLWQFSIPVLTANLIAWPVAYFYLHHWLQSYAYRIPLSPVYFLAASAITLAIAWATVIVHAVRVARANPVRALRYE